MKSVQLFSSGIDLLPTSSPPVHSALSLTGPFYAFLSCASISSPVSSSYPSSLLPPSPCFLLAPSPSLGPFSTADPAHPCCLCPFFLFPGSFFPPASPPPSPKPSWQSLLQEGRLISIANTQRPPQPDINLHLSVMNISHLPREGFIQHGRVGSGRGERGTGAGAGAAPAGVGKGSAPREQHAWGLTFTFLGVGIQPSSSGPVLGRKGRSASLLIPHPLLFSERQTKPLFFPVGSHQPRNEV